MITRLTSVCIGLVLLALCTAPAHAASPEGAVKGLFAAMARADGPAMEALLTGRAAETLPRPGHEFFPVTKAMGRAYKGIASVEVNGGRATVTVTMDGEAVAAAEAQVRRAKARGKGGRRRAMVVDDMIRRDWPRMVMGYAGATLELIKQDGRWLVSEFVTP